MARSMASRVTPALRAFSRTAKSRGLPAGSPPPSLAATVISFTSLPTTWPFLRLTIARFACSHWRPIRRQDIRQAACSRQGRRPVGTPKPALRGLPPAVTSRGLMHWIAASLLSALFLGFYELGTKHAVRDNAVLPVLF